MRKILLFLTALLGPQDIVTNTAVTYSDTSIREDLSDVIYDISPSETPVFSSLKRGKASNTLYEWQVDALEAPVSTNAQIEADDISDFDAVTQPDRKANYQQISRKTAIVGRSTEKVNHAGIDSIMGRALARKMKELKLDIEKTIQENQAADAGSSSTARTTAAFLAYLETNTVFNTSDGADPSPSGKVSDETRTDGTQQTFTVDMLDDALTSLWTEGGNIDRCTLYAGAFNKKLFSAFDPGVASKVWNMSGTGKAKITAAADVYVSEFGTIKAVPNRYGRARDVLIIDPSFASVDYLDPFHAEDLAKTGDASKKMLIVEWGLSVQNEKAHAGIFDLTTS